MSRIVVYGLGKYFEENREAISNEYNVVAYCDINKEKVRKLGGREVSWLKNNDDFDTLLVTARPMVTVPYLVDELKIPMRKILVHKYESVRKNSDMIQFHGEHMEDCILLLLINKMKKPLKKIKYLEIGVNDPIIKNNSYLLYSLGMRGVLVDALPNVKTLATLVRRYDSFVNVAVTNDKSLGDKITFYNCNYSGISSLSKEWILHAGVKETDITEIQVPQIEINDLMESIEFLPDILLLDAEGYDERLVRAIQYEKFSPSIIVAELGRPSPSLISFMKEAGYLLYTVVVDNAFFIRPERLKVIHG